MNITVKVSNTGSVDSDEVVMAFVEWEKAPHPTPSRTLVAFTRVHVAAGEAVSVTLKVPPERLAVLAVPGIGHAASTWWASEVSVRVHVGGQQPGMAVRAPSNVLDGTVAVVGKAVPLSEC